MKQFRKQRQNIKSHGDANKNKLNQAKTNQSQSNLSSQNQPAPNLFGTVWPTQTILPRLLLERLLLRLLLVPQELFP